MNLLLLLRDCVLPRDCAGGETRDQEARKEQEGDHDGTPTTSDADESSRVVSLFITHVVRTRNAAPAIPYIWDHISRRRKSIAGVAPDPRDSGSGRRSVQ